MWWYKINSELRDYGRAKGYDLGQNPTNSVLALFPGGIIIVPAILTYWRGTQRIQGAARLAGQEPVSGWLCIILYLIISPGYWAYLQVALNNLWRSEADLLPGQDALPRSATRCLRVCPRTRSNLPPRRRRSRPRQERRRRSQEPALGGWPQRRQPPCGALWGIAGRMALGWSAPRQSLLRTEP